ncbi:MAG: ATP-dependent helicase HrpB [Ilumatobacteraceae bacterium]
MPGPIPDQVADLPIVDVLDELGRVLHDRHSAVVVAPPGAGKTTVVPLWMLAQPWLSGQRIVVLEPRRLATRAAAQRMSGLLGEPVGGVVGYQTRDERRISRSTRIEVVTEGVLTRRLQHDPELPGVGVVVFDEVHERNLPTDLGLALALDARRVLRPDLRVLAMSATPETGPLIALLGDGIGPAPVVSSDGRQHPVDIRSLPVPKGTRIEQAVADAVVLAARDETGDVLVFLPGIGEIRRVESLLTDRLPGHVDVRLLAGALPTGEQDLALQPSPAGRRRIVLSTDIAESSLTVNGVRVVIDAGLARVPRFDVRTGMTRLATVTTSRASADQRAGRAGRTEPGVCYRLWGKLEQSTRLAHLPAEITQVDLAGLALELAAWRADPDTLPFLNRPPARAMQAAHQLLRLLDAIDESGAITELGRAMLELPMHPRLGRMVAAARPGDQPLACVVAAIVDERDVLRGRTDELPSDIVVRVEVVAGQRHDERADRRAVERLRDRALDVARRAGVRLVLSDIDAARAGTVLALAYPDRIGTRRSQVGQFQLRTGTGAWVSKSDPLAREQFVVAADLDGNRTSSRIRLGAGLDAVELEHALAGDIERRDSLVWDKQRNDLVHRTETRLGNMTVSDTSRAPSPGDATVAALVERVRVTRLGALDMSLAEGLRARVAFLAAHHPEEPWPDFGDARLIHTLDEWLAPYLVHATGRSDLERLDVAMLLSNQLSWDQQSELAERAPAALDTPAGRRVAIDYRRAVPTASVRVQDLFGTAVHPTVDRGAVPIALELLSPADRPIQVTSDLPGFWSGSWSAVRKDMAGRYPKHQWPSDPSVAPPRRLKER